MRWCGFQEWLEISRASPVATFFHTPHWTQLATGQDEVTAPRVELSDGTGTLLPATVDSGRLKTINSSAFGCYGGWIANRRLRKNESLVAYRSLQRSLTVGRVHVLENVREAGDVAAPSDWASEATFTDILTLDRPLEGIYRSMSTNHQRGIRKGEEAGVEVRTGSEPQDWEAYYGAYRDSLQRWGDSASSRYQFELFERVAELGRTHPELVRLWLAEVDGNTAAGALVFYWNKHAVYWHGASITALQGLRPVPLLMWHVIGDAHERGFKAFDLNPSGGHEGVARFKEQFGTNRVTVRRWSYESTAMRVHERFRSLRQRFGP